MDNFLSWLSIVTVSWAVLYFKHPTSTANYSYLYSLSIIVNVCAPCNEPFQKYSLMECIPRWQFFQNHFQQPHNLKGKKKQLLYTNQAQESFWGILALSQGNVDHLSEAWSVLPQLRANIPQYTLDKLNW